MSCTKYYPCHDITCKIELHVHTTFSDGAFTPERIVELAWERGIRFLAITDHDTVFGLEEAKNKALQYPLELIPGVELSTVYHDHEIHILGYYIDPGSPELLETLSLLTGSRRNRVLKIDENLKYYGLDITYDDVRTKVLDNGSQGRPHIALALIEHGIVKTVEEAFEKFLNPGCPGYVPRYKLSPCDAITLIKKAGGVPVLAHPGIDFPFELLPSCMETGLEGMEVYYPRHTPEMEKEYLNLALKMGLIVTGGSDFHGHETQEWRYFGEMPVPPQSIKRLKEMSPEKTY